jgi:hypothetical protein
MSTEPPSAQLQFCKPAVWFSTDGWLDKGQELTKYGKALKSKNDELTNRQGVLQWDIGDWLLEGKDGGVATKVLSHKKFKRHALEITGYKNWKSLENLMTVCRRIPDGPESRRRDGREGRPFLAYSIHCVAAKWEDAEPQIRVLDLAAEGELKGSVQRGWTRVPMAVRTLERLVRVKQKQGELPLTDGDKRLEAKRQKARPEGYTLVKILVPNALYSRLSFLSGYGLTEGHFKERYESPTRLFVFFASQYAKEHRAEIDAHVQAVQDKSRKLAEESKQIVAERAAMRAAEAEARKRQDSQTVWNSRST